MEVTIITSPAWLAGLIRYFIGAGVMAVILLVLIIVWQVLMLILDWLFGK